MRIAGRSFSRNLVLSGPSSVRADYVLSSLQIARLFSRVGEAT